MITTYDVARMLKKQKERGDPAPFYLDEDGKTLIDNETNKGFSTVDEFADYLRKNYHCDFECIFHEHASLTTIYRCKECGTVIFGGDDERYDPKLCCPTCGNYKTHLTYWTKEEIDLDVNKQSVIKAYEKWTEKMRERDARRERRHGLYDWQLFSKAFNFKKYRVRVELIDCSHPWDKDELYEPWYKRMITLEFTFYKKDEEFLYIRTKSFSIPLTPYTIRTRYIWRKKLNERPNQN